MKTTSQWKLDLLVSEFFRAQKSEVPGSGKVTAAFAAVQKRLGVSRWETLLFLEAQEQKNES